METKVENEVPTPIKQCSRVGAVHTIEINHKHDAKTNSFKKQCRKGCGNILNNYHKKEYKHGDLGTHIGAICLSIYGIFLVTWFSEPLRGYPLERFWPPLGHPWSDILICLLM